VRYWGTVIAIAVALFYGGRRLGRAHAGPSSVETPGSAPAAATNARGTSVALRTSMQTLLEGLARAPSPGVPPSVDRAPSEIERSTVEPAAVTEQRRAHVAAEIDQRAPGLAAPKRSLLLAEADRLAWDKRSLRAAFLVGKLSEADYVDALKDDIRSSLATFEDALTDEEYAALFNRARGSDADPFTLESLVGRPRPAK
jgi:hypothetical protein